MYYKKHIVLLSISLFFFVFCQGQSVKHRETLHPKVKTTILSLYPNATSEIVLDTKYVSDTTQEVSINCHCTETAGQILLVIDTNGDLLNKEVHYHSSKGLPDAIVNYMKKNTSPTCMFTSDEYMKYINKKGEISYGIYMNNSYILKLKSNGEYISKEKIPEMER